MIPVQNKGFPPRLWTGHHVQDLPAQHPERIQKELCDQGLLDRAVSGHDKLVKKCLLVKKIFCHCVPAKSGKQTPSLRLSGQKRLAGLSWWMTPSPIPLALTTPTATSPHPRSKLLGSAGTLGSSPRTTTGAEVLD